MAGARHARIHFHARTHTHTHTHPHAHAHTHTHAHAHAHRECAQAAECAPLWRMCPFARAQVKRLGTVTAVSHRSQSPQSVAVPGRPARQRVEL